MSGKDSEALLMAVGSFVAERIDKAVSPIAARLEALETRGSSMGEAEKRDMAKGTAEVIAACIARDMAPIIARLDALEAAAAKARKAGKR